MQLLLLGVLGGAAEVSRLPPAEAATHLLLASLNQQFEALANDLDAALACGPESWMRLWQRDRGVLQLARSARLTRQTRAADVFGLSPDEGLRP